MIDDFEILIFLWRWKLVSTAAIGARFFQGRAAISPYLRLSSLKKLGLVRYQYFEIDRIVAAWTLTAKGFKVIRPLLPQLREDGFRSEAILHDWITTAIHLGEWLPSQPDGTDLFSEQQMRRLSLDDYPAWIPRTDLHRPDGYWRVRLPQGVGTVALEVELSTKYPHNYRAVADFYRDHPRIFRVVWLTDTLHTAKTIQSRLRDGAPSHIGIHNFVLKADFFRLGWNALLKLGAESNRPLAFLLGSESITRPAHGHLRDLLDLRKAPHRSRTYTAEQHDRIRHRLGVSRLFQSPPSLVSSNSSDPRLQPITNYPERGNPA